MIKKDLSKLFDIAINPELSLDVRYAAVRQMQMEGTPKYHTKRYTEEEMNFIEWHSIREAARRLGRSEHGIRNKRFQLRRMRA